MNFFRLCTHFRHSTEGCAIIELYLDPEGRRPVGLDMVFRKNISVMQRIASRQGSHWLKEE